MEVKTLPHDIILSCPVLCQHVLACVTARPGRAPWMGEG